MIRFNHLRIILLTGCLVSVTTVHSQSTIPPLTAIAFYNLENLYDTEDDPRKYDEAFTPKGPNHYTESIYKQKLHNLASVIKQLAFPEIPDGPALVGAAEAENDKVLQDLVDQPELKKRQYRFVHFEGPDTRGIDVALIYQPRKFKMLSARSVPINLQQSGEDGITRDVLFVHGVLLGDTIYVLVNHWPSRRGSEAATATKRAIAAGVCRHLIDSIQQQEEDAKIIVMGDLNDDPVDASVTKVLKAKGNRNQVKSGAIFNPWASIYRRGTGTLAYNDSWSLFDQIMISAPLLDTMGEHWVFYKAEVFNKEFLKNRSGPYKGYPHRSFDGETWINGYSDHFPTIIYLKKRKNRDPQ